MISRERAIKATLQRKSIRQLNNGKCARSVEAFLLKSVTLSRRVGGDWRSVIFQVSYIICYFSHFTGLPINFDCFLSSKVTSNDV